MAEPVFRAVGRRPPGGDRERCGPVDSLQGLCHRLFPSPVLQNTFQFRVALGRLYQHVVFVLLRAYTRAFNLHTHAP